MQCKWPTWKNKLFSPLVCETQFQFQSPIKYDCCRGVWKSIRWKSSSIIIGSILILISHKIWPYSYCFQVHHPTKKSTTIIYQQPKLLHTPSRQGGAGQNGKNLSAGQKSITIVVVDQIAGQKKQKNTRPSREHKNGKKLSTGYKKQNNGWTAFATGFPSCHDVETMGSKNKKQQSVVGEENISAAKDRTGPITKARRAQGAALSHRNIRQLLDKTAPLLPPK